MRSAVPSTAPGRRGRSDVIFHGNTMDEHTKLLDKIRLIQALHAGATTDGERDAAADALRRVSERLASLKVTDPPTEFRFSMDNTGRASFSWRCSGAIDCAVSLLPTAAKHGHGASSTVVRRPALEGVWRWMKRFASISTPLPRRSSPNQSPGTLPMQEVGGQLTG